MNGALVYLSRLSSFHGCAVERSIYGSAARGLGSPDVPRPAHGGAVQPCVPRRSRHWRCGLEGSALTLLVLLLLAPFSGVAIGLVLSALARTSEMAIALIPIVLLLAVILGGVMQPLHRMHGVTQRFCGANPARWTIEGMMLSQSRARPKSPVPAGPVQDMAEHYFPVDTHRSPPALPFSLRGLCCSSLPVSCS